MATNEAFSRGDLAPQALTGFGVAFGSPEWIGYVTVIALVLVAAKSWKGRSSKSLDLYKSQCYKLSKKTPVSHNTAIYRFKLHSSDSILGLPIGQHITVGANIDGKDIARSYTPISSDRDKGYFDLLVKSYPTGNISKLIGNLAIGETINVKGPKGQMIYTHGLVREFGMIAGGTGITPMLQIIRAVLANHHDKTICNLVYANVNEDDILLKPELDQLAAADSRLKIHYVLNNPPPNWDGSTGFVTSEIIKAHCPAPAANVKLLICGPPPMVNALKKHTLELGYDKIKPVSKMTDQVFSF